MGFPREVCRGISLGKTPERFVTPGHIFRGNALSVKELARSGFATFADNPVTGMDRPPSRTASARAGTPIPPHPCQISCRKLLRLIALPGLRDRIFWYRFHMTPGSRRETPKKSSRKERTFNLSCCQIQQASYTILLLPGEGHRRGHAAEGFRSFNGRLGHRLISLESLLIVSLKTISFAKDEGTIRL